ncbi:DUF4834 family protein [Eudoraea adriatica]|uniref:DUF4834 family protein n=1 Tax=Eudoraea adriatica TaxID=446681 RepID=UPI00037D3B49|nr:DUF4834 family protein [Eudoraea adriatica]
MGFLRTILIILLVYYMFKLFAKWFGPKIFAYAARRTEKHFKERFEQFQGYQNHEETINEGEIRIDKKTVQKRKKDSEHLGEFIDFEEIE